MLADQETAVEHYVISKHSSSAKESEIDYFVDSVTAAVISHSSEGVLFVDAISR